MVYLNRSRALGGLDRHEEALADLGARIRLREDLVQREGRSELRDGLALAYNNAQQAKLLLRMGQRENACQRARREHGIVIAGKLDVVGDQDVDVVRFQATQRRVEAALHRGRREIEFVGVDAPRFRAEVDLLSPTALQDFAEDLFRTSFAIIGPGIDEIDAGIDGGVNAIGNLRRGNRAILLADRRAALAENGYVHAGSASSR